MNTHNISKHIASRLFVLMVTMLYFAPAFAQESQQFAIYNYRNDGDFNAWLDIDVEKITYSCTDLDGVEHDDIVVQEVWTPDSVYRIPINAIDSIGFRAPKIEYQDNVFHITEAHLPYIISVDDNSITFSGSLPESMRPQVGQVITSDTFESPLSDGFAGKVTSANNVSGTFQVVCEAVQVTDVFKKLVIVGKAYAVNEGHAKQSPRLAPQKLSEYLDTDRVEFEFPGEVEVKIGDFISISDVVSMSADYYVYVDLPRFKLRATVTGNHDLKTKWTIDSDKILEWLGHDKEKSEPEWATPVWPIVSIPGVFNFGVRAGAFLAPSVKLSLTGSTPLTFSHTFGVEFSNKDTWSWIPTTTPIMSAHSELGTPDITLSLEGKLFAGVAVGIKTVLIGDKVLSGDITGRFGPEFDAKMQMQQKLGDDDQFDWYSLLKDSKMGVQLKADAKVKAKVFGENLTDNLSWEWKWPIPQWSDFRYLFPDFTKPELRYWSMPNPLSMYTTPSRDLIMPVQVGIGLFDMSGVKQADYYNDEWYLLDVNWHDKDTRIDVGNLTPGETYTCRPLLNFLGLGEIKADPRTTFTVPQPVSLESTTITVQKDKAQNVAVNGGWGDYSVTVLDKSVCTAELKQDGDSYYIQIVGKKDGGSTSVTLKDLRSQKTAAVLVSVTNEVVQKLIKVEPTEIDFGAVPVGTSKTEHFTVSNVGTTALTFNVSEQHTEIDIPESGKEFTLAAGESKTFDVIFTPTNPNGGSGSAVRVFSDAENGTQYVTIDGQGAPADLPCAIKVEPAEIDFGTVPQGTSKTEYFTVSNIGQSDLVFKINEADEPFFISEAGVEHTLSAGQSKQFSVTYSGEYGPGTSGQAFVTIDTNATNVEWGFGLSLKAEGGKPDDIVAYTSCPDDHHPHLIDLGLPSGTKWACCNVGAEKPEDYGGYFAWGETSEKSTYDWSTYIHCDGSYSTCHDIGKDIAGTQYDAATANWGSPWVMPNKEQMEELINSCTSEWTTVNGVNGRRFTGPNGASVFLPAAGFRWVDGGLYNAGSYGIYWSSSLYESDTSGAWHLDFYSGGVNTYNYNRNYGRSVRPVRKN